MLFRSVVAVATHLGVKPLNVDEALSKFGGTWRRFEYKGEVSGAKVYDDYGHHPTEIKATMQGARELYPDREITIVFQSHTYTRTHELFNDFVDVLSEADRVIVLPIYFAREENESGVSHTKLADAIKEKNKNVRALDTVEEAVTELKKSLSVKDVVITMGAGDMTSIVAKGLISN